MLRRIMMRGKGSPRLFDRRNRKRSREGGELDRRAKLCLVIRPGEAYSPREESIGSASSQRGQSEARDPVFQQFPPAQSPAHRFLLCEKGCLQPEEGRYVT